MTTQFPESLTFKGENMPLVSFPLEQWFALLGTEKPFKVMTTACWRGYLGDWDIVGDRLYLTALSGTLMNGEAAKLETVFPGFGDRVFAHWFTGALDIPRGRPLSSISNPYIVPYEQTLKLTFRRGVLVSERLQVNGTAPDGDVDTGYPIAAATYFGSSGGRAR